MIKVLFDHQTFSLQRYGGISRYFFNLYKAQESYDEYKADISLLYSRNYYAKDFKAPLNNFLGKWLLDQQKKNYKWNKKYSKYCISKNNFDVLHPTYYEPYFLKKLKKPFVITVHDMIHELMPECFDSTDINAQNKKLCIENASHIIAISENTKRDLINILGVEENKISVIHHGHNIIQQIDNLFPPNKYGKYLLFVGERSAYKNFKTFIISVRQILSKHKNIKVICAGGGEFNEVEQALFKKLNIVDQVIQTTATDLQLTSLYKNALAFIFPSLYEGFGLPILEAFHNKCPMVISDSSCFKEIAADAAEYFNPLDEHSILKAILNVIEDNNKAEILVKKGVIRLENFTIEKSVQKTISLYKSIV